MIKTEKKIKREETTALREESMHSHMVRSGQMKMAVKHTDKGARKGKAKEEKGHLFRFGWHSPTI